MKEVKEGRRQGLSLVGCLQQLYLSSTLEIGQAKLRMYYFCLNVHLNQCITSVKEEPIQSEL